MIRPILGLVVVAAAGAGCSCQPELPDEVRPIEDTSNPPVDTSRTDTAPEPPCEAPEVEPNDTVGAATPLPMEVVGCGEWSAPGDIDYFSFDLHEEGWVRVFVDAKVLGSFADAHLVVQSADGTAALRTDDLGTTDATLVFPGTPQRYDVQLVEQNFQGDADRYFYEVVASVTKPPVTWSRGELEPNDGSSTAEPVDDGEVVFGTMKSNLDSDWFVVTVPPGKHTLRAEVVAFAEGSAGDYALMLYNADVAPLPLGCNACAIKGPLGASGKDPAFEWDSPGNEVLYFRVYEQEGKNGGAFWYTLDVRLEAS